MSTRNIYLEAGRVGSEGKPVERASSVDRTKGRLWVILGAGSLSLFLLFLTSLVVGSYAISVPDALNAFINVILHGGETTTPDEKIVYLIRFPRFLAAVGVGVSLSIAGAVMQAIVRNPLVDPYITGVSSGAAFGAVSLMTLGFATGSLAMYALPIAAFIGAIVAFVMTIALSETAGGKPIAFVLSGVVVGYVFSSLTNIIEVQNPEHLKGVLFWLFGSLKAPDLTEDAIIISCMFIVGAIVLLYARELNVILLGEDQANQLGVNVRRVKVLMLGLTSILTAVCVAFTGVIAFLGLIVPHMARILVGGDHRLLLPASIILGANFLLAADIFTRLVGELPIGAVISLIGAPFFAYLLVTKGRDYGS